LRLDLSAGDHTSFPTTASAQHIEDEEGLVRSTLSSSLPDRDLLNEPATLFFAHGAIVVLAFLQLPFHAERSPQFF
jgi:hypothetical protein